SRPSPGRPPVSGPGWRSHVHARQGGRDHGAQHPGGAEAAACPGAKGGVPHVSYHAEHIALIITGREFAQFITLCSASILAWKRTSFSPFQRPSPAKTRTSWRPSCAYGHHLRPSTNCYKLSDQSL